VKTGPLSPMLSVETFETGKNYLISTLAKPRPNAEAIFTSVSSLFVDAYMTLLSHCVKIC